MAHQSLYRVHRPRSFSELVGQDHIVKPLQEQLATKKVGHAYLFSGSRGLGKTSVARIFASELGTDTRDLYEIDAASNNSVDDIRALTEQVYTLPFNSTFKVYILDEAHMLSKGAWNAFLKTLEEPPAHVIFILATTELQKVPETVRSRCQVFEFKKPSRHILTEVIASVAKKEGYSLEASGTDLLAMLADGSYRDALSILEKVLACATDKKLTLEEVEQATGAPRHALVHALVDALSKGATADALTAVHTAVKQGVDMSLYLSLVLEFMRQILLVRHAPELRKSIQSETGSDVYAEIEVLASLANSKLTHETLRVFLDASSRIRFSPIPALPLELAVMEVSKN